MSARVVHFEIHAENPERAMNYYSDMFGWTFKQWGEMEYWMVMTGEEGTAGINGGLMKRKGPSPVDGQAVNAYPCTLQVDNLDELVAKHTSGGHTIALPKMPIPTMGWLIYLKDTEGNIFGLMQNDPSAK